MGTLESRPPTPLGKECLEMWGLQRGMQTSGGVQLT